jgi:hypothetical protein
MLLRHSQHEFSFEGHPNTTHAHLQSFTIWDLGELGLVFKITHKSKSHS